MEAQIRSAKNSIPPECSGEDRFLSHDREGSKLAVCTITCGAKTLVATNRGTRWFFVFGFEKNERANISDGELEALQTLAAEGALAAGSLSKQDLETIKLLVSEQTGCDYCVAAHTLLGKMTGLPADVLKQIRAGQATSDAKRDALVHFVLNLQKTSGTISESEVAAIRAAGYTDTQLAEISLTIALTIFTNTFNRINDTVVDFPPVK